MATLILSKLGFDARHGATAAERRSDRRFEVDVEIDTDVSGAESSDKLTDTVDFRVLSELIVGIGTEGEPHHLIESLARRMVTALAERIPGARIRLELRKLAPPYCAGTPEFAAVRLTHGM